MKLSVDLTAFSMRIGYAFNNPEHLIEALTHASLSSTTRPDNQRLEFLGDRVLGLVMAEALLAADPTATEGLLAPRFNSLVRKETCAKVAQSIDLGAVLKLGRSETMSGGRRKQALLGDAMESVIAAVYVDGGFDAARDLILRLWATQVAAAKTDARDAKTMLQEWAQSRGLPPPAYTETSRSGPDHAPVFTIVATLATGEKAEAKANSKRLAQQDAAALMLKQMENSDV